MEQREQASDTIGHSVIAHREGAQLGAVTHVFVDPESKHVAGMTLRSRPLGKESWFGVEEIELIGKDIVLLKGEASVTPFARNDALNGSKSLTELRGMRVVTVDGRMLGTVKDFEVRGDDWSISELCLDKRRRLPVDGNEFNLGADQIMVPTGYGNRIVEEPQDKPGFFSRLFSTKEE